jgi:hypothetical protein
MGGKQVGDFHAAVLRTAALQGADPGALFRATLSRWLAKPLTDVERRHPYACFAAAWGDLTAQGDRAVLAPPARRQGRMEPTRGTTAEDFKNALPPEEQMRLAKELRASRKAAANGE